MNRRRIISTDQAPAAIGTYSQAVAVDGTVYLSGQIPLDPGTMELVASDSDGPDIDRQIEQVIVNLSAVAKAAGGSLDDFVRLTVYLTDLAHFPRVNEIMARHFSEPYPARAAVGIRQLPRDALVEMDAIMALP